MKGFYLGIRRSQGRSRHDMGAFPMKFSTVTEGRLFLLRRSSSKKRVSLACASVRGRAGTNCYLLRDVRESHTSVKWKRLPLLVLQRKRGGVFGCASFLPGELSQLCGQFCSVRAAYACWCVPAFCCFVAYRGIARGIRVVAH